MIVDHSSLPIRTAAISLLALAFLAIGAAVGENLLMALGGGLAGAEGGWRFWRLVRQPVRYFSLLYIYSAALNFWCLGGCMIALLLGDPLILGLYDVGDTMALMEAGGLVMLTSWAMLIAAPLENRLWRPVVQDILAGYRGEAGMFQGIAIIAAMVGILLLIQQGEIAFRYIALIEGGVLSGIALIGLQIGCALVPVAGWALGLGFHVRGGILTAALAVAALVGIFLLLGQGRMPLATHLFAFMLLLFWTRGWHRSKSRLYLSAAVILPVLFFGAMAFQAMREDVQEGGDIAETGMFERFDNALGRLNYTWQDTRQVQEQTLPSRIFLLRYLFELVREGGDANFGNGNGTLAEVLVGIPSFLLENKTDIIIGLGGVGEERNPDFRLPEMDYANTAVTTGYMDFGWMSVGWNTLFIGVIGALFAFLARVVPLRLFKVLVVGVLLSQFSTAESLFYTLAVNYLRLLVLMVPVAVALYVLDRLIHRPERTTAVLPEMSR